jgi:hypothetical protein
MFAVENRESTHDDGPSRSESVRDTISRSIREVRGGGSDRDSVGFRHVDDRAPHMSNVADNVARRDVVEAAVREQRDKPKLQEHLDNSRRAAAEAKGFERMRRYFAGDAAPNRQVTVRSGKNPSVRESIYAALEERSLPRQMVDSVDHISGAVKTSLAQQPQGLDEPPPHWNVDRNEYRALPDEVRSAAHGRAREVAEFQWHRNQISNPNTAGPYVKNLNERYPLTIDLVEQGGRWLMDPRRQPIEMPRFEGIPPGWSREAWMATTVAVRAAALEEAQQVHTWQYANKLMENPQTRLQGYALLAQTYPHVEQLFKQAYAQQNPQQYAQQQHPVVQQQQQIAQQYGLPSPQAAERYVTDWARGKPHYGAVISDGQGGAVPVKTLMGVAINQGLAQPSVGDPFALQAALDIVVNAARAEGHLLPDRRRAAGKSGRPSSMRGGAPSPSAPPPHRRAPSETVHDSIKRSLAELRAA